jgi:hypothetical protein
LTLKFNQDAEKFRACGMSAVIAICQVTNQAGFSAYCRGRAARTCPPLNLFCGILSGSLCI